MKYFFSTLLFFLILGNTQATSQLDKILTQHFAAVGNDHFLHDYLTCQMNGTVNIAAWDLGLKFQWTQYNNEYFYFNQEGLEEGMTFTPPIQQIVNKEGAFFRVDESKMGKGKSVKQLPEVAKAIALEMGTVMVHPLFYFQKMGFELTLLGETLYQEKKVFEIEVIGLSTNPIKVFVNTKNYLLEGIQFTSFHPQTGLFFIDRSIESYAKKNGLHYPNNWIDRRPDMSLDFEIKEVILSKEIDKSLFAVEMMESSSATISSKQVLSIINAYVAALEKDSPFDEANEKIKQGLSTYFEYGKYDKALTSESLANILSADIIALTDDYHFGIDYNSDLFAALNSDGDAMYEADAEYDKLMLKEEQANDFFIHEEQKLKSDYFYFRIDQMPRIRYAKPVVDALMQKASRCKGLVIDLRDNTGGAGNFNTYLASYLLPQNTLLFDRIYKQETMQLYTEPTTAILNSLQDMPIYLLVNKRTVSAGEQLAYLLQNHGRAKVIGTSTFGAAHGSIDVPLMEGLIALVPIVYEKHVKSQKDWEGTGVLPDLEKEFKSLDDLDVFLSKQ